MERRRCRRRERVNSDPRNVRTEEKILQNSGVRLLTREAINVFGPAKSALSATAAKVDPHLLVPAAGASLVFDAAGDEVWSAVAVPVRHANAGGLPAIVVGDEQLW